mgnify:FL=1
MNSYIIRYFIATSTLVSFSILLFGYDYDFLNTGSLVQKTFVTSVTVIINLFGAYVIFKKKFPYRSNTIISLMYIVLSVFVLFEYYSVV